jgi:hypothetical protein
VASAACAEKTRDETSHKTQIPQSATMKLSTASLAFFNLLALGQSLQDIDEGSSYYSSSVGSKGKGK